MRKTNNTKQWWMLILMMGSALFARPESVFAEQLDENCVVSVLNRTIQVGEDGRWSMPNVPSSMGQIRARATCVRNSVTESGRSDYFNAGTTNAVEVRGR